MAVVTADIAISMMRGEPMADDGRTYDTVQDAENAASSWVFVPPGTFQENVSVDTDNLELIGAGGSGKSTLIDGGDGGDAINISAAGVVIRNIGVETDTGLGGQTNGIGTSSGADELVIQRVHAFDADTNGVSLDHGTDHIIVGCVADGTIGTRGYSVFTNRTRIIGCISKGGVQNDGVHVSSSDSYIVGCTSFGAGDKAIEIGSNGDDNIVCFNRCHNAGDDGIAITGNDNIVVNNRVSGSSGADIGDNGTNTLLSDNRTGAAN